MADYILSPRLAGVRYYLVAFPNYEAFKAFKDHPNEADFLPSLGTMPSGVVAVPVADPHHQRFPPYNPKG